MIVRLTDQAKADVTSIGDWIAADNPARAETFIDELVERSHSLAQHPNRFPVAACVNGQDIRKLSHADYLIFYSVGE